MDPLAKLLLVVVVLASFVLNWGLSQLMAFGTPDRARVAYRISKMLALVPSCLLPLGLSASPTDSPESMMTGICFVAALGGWLNVLCQKAILPQGGGESPQKTGV